MSPQQQCAALALVRWRERYAQSLDRPRRWIMGDELLLRIARTLPEDLESLKSIDTHLTLERPDKNELQAFQVRVRGRADELGIQSEVLATRKEIGDILVDRPSGRVDEGWRQLELQSLLADRRQ